MLAQSMHHNALLTQNNALHLLCIKFGFQEFNVELNDADGLVLQDNILIDSKLSQFISNLGDVDGFESLLLLKFGQRQKILKNIILCQIIDNFNPENGIFEFGIFNFGVTESKFFDLLMLFEDSSGFNWRSAIRELNNKLNTIKER